MILRVRSCAGTWRITVNGNNISSLKLSIKEIHGIDEKEQILSKDPQGINIFMDENSSFENIGISHGDMIYLQGNVIRGLNGGFIIEKDDEVTDNIKEEEENKPNVRTNSSLPSTTTTPNPTQQQSNNTKDRKPLESNVTHDPSSSSSSSFPSRTSLGPLVSHDPISETIRQPDNMRHERLIEANDPFDAVDLAMNLAASTQFLHHDPNLNNPDHINSLSSNIRNILDQSTMSVSNDRKRELDLDFVNQMASEVISLQGRINQRESNSSTDDGSRSSRRDGSGRRSSRSRRRRSNDDESIARLLQIAEAQAESTISPQLYDDHPPLRSDMKEERDSSQLHDPLPSSQSMIDDEEALNHAIQLSLYQVSTKNTTPLSSSPSPSSSSSSSSSSTSSSMGQEDSLFAQELRNIEARSYQKAKEEHDRSNFQTRPTSLQQGSMGISSSNSLAPMDRALLARRRADQILEASRTGQPWPKASLSPIPPSSSTSSSSSTSASPSLTRNTFSTTNAINTNTPTSTVSSVESRIPFLNDVSNSNHSLGSVINQSNSNNGLLVEEDEDAMFIASAVAASINDIIEGGDQVTQDMNHLEQALAQSVFQQESSSMITPPSSQTQAQTQVQRRDIGNEAPASSSLSSSSSSSSSHVFNNDIAHLDIDSNDEEDDELKRAIQASLSY